MEYYNQSPSKFADELGVIRSSISHIISGRNKPGLDLIQKLLTTFPEVDADWLLLGKGKMIQPKLAEPKSPSAQLSLFEQERQESKEQEVKKEEAVKKTAENIKDYQINQTGNISQNLQEISSSKAPVITAPAGPIKRITVYYGDKSFQDFYPDAE